MNKIIVTALAAATIALSAGAASAKHHKDGYVCLKDFYTYGRGIGYVAFTAVKHKHH